MTIYLLTCIGLILIYLIYRRFVGSFSVKNEDLRNRRVIITGASRGIGEELAYQYSQHQCRLILASRNIERLENVILAKCLRLGATDVKCIRFDASKESDCRILIEKTVEFYQGIDILVLNHTASVYRHFFEENLSTNIEDMKDSFQTNFFGYFYPTMNALPYLKSSGRKERRSQIIAISSLAGTCPLPKTTIYGTTKHAIQGFFLNLSRDIIQSIEYSNRISITLVILGLIGTDSAMERTDDKIHFLAANVRQTAQCIIQSGLQGKTKVFYPKFCFFIPQIYFLFSPLFDLLARIGN